jgi:hypothetical protein
MVKTRITVTLDEGIFRAVTAKAARTGKQDSQVIEEALRHDLESDEFENVWARVTPTSETESLEFASAELHAMREEKRGVDRR